uniref:Fucosyltransferase n=1 Tax=Chromera velia CCMP2878 TaxID=1169474 RepID=A0A0G4I7Z2_9ALVE|eukprot:Cvel_11727.t1-p1 / transcript=Cvel_11727.t1 / gene=Cvel_11727 / organism=Chromera_velia_CCMP2878 / gene_product=Alpha-(1,3)-fucosyltransferase 10, putative / transcript_product=Alpha-(1,3)-fucosyltransferase 10, putative / location=Cvel_scaffold744:37503-40697(+) / protein_length=796 / sequence_SO=supercontig / SO=protein_coding / is_pseudo=false
MMWPTLVSFLLVALCQGGYTRVAVDEYRSYTNLCIGILSKAENVDKRQHIRETWMQFRAIKEKRQVIVIFVIAATTIQKEVRWVELEMKENKDVLYLEDQPEGYRNLPHQTHRMFDFFTSEPNASQYKCKLILKGDDDLYISPRRLMKTYRHLDIETEWVEKLGTDMVLAGWTHPGPPVHRAGKWGVTMAEYPHQKWPKAASGPLYGASFALARRLAELYTSNGRKVPVHLEDISVALHIQYLQQRGEKIAWLHDDSFKPGYDCIDKGYNVLISEGAPMYLDFRTGLESMFANEKKMLREKKESGFCVRGTYTDEFALRRTRDAVVGRNGSKDAVFGQFKKCRQLAASVRDYFSDGPRRIGTRGDTRGLQEEFESFWNNHIPLDSECGLTRGEREGDPPGVRIVYYDSKWMNIHHELLSVPWLKKQSSLWLPRDQQDLPGGLPVQVKCALNFTCVVSDDSSPASIDSANLVVFAADHEYFSRDPRLERKLPRLREERAERIGKDAAAAAPLLYAGALREAVGRLPEGHWAKYERQITYDVEKSWSVNGYLDESIGDMMREMSESRTFFPLDKRKGNPDGPSPLAFVTRQCQGGPLVDPQFGIPDGRTQRSNFVLELRKHIGVDSYGNCLSSRPWPKDHMGDKHHVMRTHKYCLAIENAPWERWYHTEKIWDCWKAAAVPVYVGHPETIKWFLPTEDAAIIWPDTTDAAGLAKLILSETEEQWEKRREWMGFPSFKWQERMLGYQNTDAVCRLCKATSEELQRLKSMGGSGVESNEDVAADAQWSEEDNVCPVVAAA